MYFAEIKCWCYKHVIFRQYCWKDKAYVLNHEIILGVLFPRLIANPVWWDWSWKARFIKDKNNSAAGYVSSSLTVCVTPFFVHKRIVTEKIAVKFLFVCKIKVIGMLLLHVNIVHRQVQKSKQHVTKRYSKLHNHSTLLCFSQTQETLKLKKLPSQLRYPLLSIIITITSNKPWNTETHKTYRNPPITDHKPWPFEPI